ncbi:MAG TPA: hypothetical protein VF692_08870 [Pyrinomonadaceae bacterium]|jgi:hypothetical protein
MKAKLRAEPSRKSDFFCIESYGVQIGFEIGEGISRSMIKKRLKLVLPNGFKEIKESSPAHYFRLSKNADQTFDAGENDQEIIGKVPEGLMFEQLERRVRMAVAEYAVDKVFLHAGVVGWNGRAIVIPAKSFHGKTTLVAELVKKGAVYYSDEYAVLDEDGLVHPFPKMLSMRGIIDDHQQVDVRVEKLGGVAGDKAIPVGMILFTQFQAKARWLPRALSPGRGLLEIIAHTLPIRNKPEFTLKVLNNVMNRAIITKTKRGDAARTAELIIGFIEKQKLKS